LKRFDFFFYRDQFTELFNRQDLQFCHILAEAAAPPGLMSREDAKRSGVGEQG
jgi:hypothetical protein